MNPLERAIERIIHTDPIREAEKITGLSYKEDEATDALGTLLHFKRVKDKEALLSLAGDTLFHNKLDRYLEIAESIGFKIVHKIPFTVEDRNECQYFLYKPGCLIEMDTYHTLDVNSSSVYYNWRPYGGLDAFYKKEREDGVIVISSGCWMKDEDIWYGSHDGREALRHRINLLETYGEFVTPWRERPFHGLCHYGVYRDTQHIEKEKGFWQRILVTDAITEDIVLQLPEEVRNIIPPPRKKNEYAS